MISPEQVTDYIFSKLSPISSFYIETHKNPKKSVLSLPKNSITITAVDMFITKMKGIIRKSESCDLKIEGPIDKGNIYEWVVTTFHYDIWSA
jgi:hypothetical protein